MCYLMVWNPEKRFWEKLQGTKPKAGVLAHAVVCTNNQNPNEYFEEISYLRYKKNTPVYRLGIESECSCKDCLKILQSFPDNVN
jgi:hypothetical protein